ncbi:MAG: peptidoglycan-binding protein [Candidatus Gracilibacteria bacterium]
MGKHTFKVSAYYSPLRGQENYLRGNYEAEIRLNGRGEFGASGVAVHPGMIAAPKTYPFGTKIQLNGLGVGTVEDRGGAIVAAGNNGHNYDRLDVWMGYGDEGLQRALQWGVRVVDGEILSNSSALDTINYGGLQEQINGKNSSVKKEEPALDPAEAMLLQAQVQELAERDELLNSFPANIGVGASGNQVRLIQAAFSKLGYYRGKIDGVYGYELANSILTFQVSKKIVSSEDDPAAGYFGLKTRVTLIEILMNKKVKIDELAAEVTLAQKDISKQKVEIASAKNEVKADTIIPNMPASQMEIASLVAAPKSESKNVPVLIAISTTSTVPFIQAEKPRTTEYNDPIDFKTPTISADLIQDVQAKLMTMGYNPGPINGKWNAQTRTAMRQFQIKNNLPITEKITPEAARSFDTIMKTSTITWSMPGAESLPEKSQMIEELQKYMKRKGLYTGLATGKADAAFFKGMLKIGKEDTFKNLFPSLYGTNKGWGEKKM